MTGELHSFWEKEKYGDLWCKPERPVGYEAGPDGFGLGVVDHRELHEIVRTYPGVGLV